MEQLAMSKKKKAETPIHTIRRGAIKASIWRRQTPTGFEYLDFTIARTWAQKNGKEASAANYFADNEIDLIDVVRDCSEFIANYSAQDNREAEPVNGHAVNQ